MLAIIFALLLLTGLPAPVSALDRTEPARFGTVIRQRREDLGLTQAQLGELLGIPQCYVSRLEGGKNWPQPTRLTQLATALQVEPWELLERMGWDGVIRVRGPNADHDEVSRERARLLEVVRDELTEWEVKGVLHFLREANHTGSVA